MIIGFKSPETEKLFNGEKSWVPADVQATALRKLNLLNAAPDINSLRVPPGNRLEKLSGNRQGQYSIRINDQWRICFMWDDTAVSASDVEIVDYH